MATPSVTAITTAHDLLKAPDNQNGGAQPFTAADSSQTSQAAPMAPRKKYRHVTAFHSASRPSCLSHDAENTPSFLGFRNLMVLILIFMNLRLVIENFVKYGVLICIRCHDYRRQDVLLGLALFAIVPCHLFIAWYIESLAAKEANTTVKRRRNSDAGENAPENANDRKNFDQAWRHIVIAHTINGCFCAGVTSWIVYNHIHHPGIGTVSELHAIVVTMKIASYALTNRDLRHARIYPYSSSALPELYRQCPYPQNVTVSNLSYFWFAPTLVYQPVYPRTDRIRWSFVAKRVAETIFLSIFIWICSAQYAAPLLRNSLDGVASLNIPSIAERLMKLSTISVVVWLAGFFALFQSYLNALAEVMRFGDRVFYEAWWNSTDLKIYWSTWNKPVYHFMRRHVFSPLVGRGWSSHAASAAVFFVSGVLHEMAVGIPTHSLLGVAFIGMVIQLPLIFVTSPLSRVQGKTGKIIGNCIFWVSFCLVGQPLAALLYFFAWQAKYGSVSRSVGEV